MVRPVRPGHRHGGHHQHRRVHCGRLRVGQASRRGRRLRRRCRDLRPGAGLSAGAQRNRPDLLTLAHILTIPVTFCLALAVDFSIGFPVAVDSDYRIWRAFRNSYWPAAYFVDAHGNIRHHQFGEGDYANSERVIQALLAEAGQPSTARDVVAPLAEGAQAAPDLSNLRSGETYLGYLQAANFASPAEESRILSGFTSRCTTLWRCSSSRARATW